MMNITSILVLLLSVVAHSLAGSSSSPNRTVVFLYFDSVPGQDVFIRGGLDRDAFEGNCTLDLTTDPCVVPMRTHLLGTIAHYEKYNSWRVMDNHLDWFGPEPEQGLYKGQKALGTPLAWTTDDVLNPGYQALNEFGESYWMVDMEMDCTVPGEEGWFDLKALLLNNYQESWEPDISQEPCTGTVGGKPPYTSINHMGKCGCINVFVFGESNCTINDFTS